MVADIPCEFRGLNDLEEFIGVVQPTDKFSETYSAGAFRTAMSVKEGRIPDRVFNCLNKPRKIYRCSSIEDLYPEVGEEESFKESSVAVGYKVVPSGDPKEDGEVRLKAKHCGTVFVEGFEGGSFSVEEMFPVNSDWVPDVEKRRHYEVLSTYADWISKGPWDLGYAKGLKHTIDTGSA